LRKELGFTHAHLGDNIRLDTSNVHQLEPGKNFTLDTLIRIAGFLEVHSEDILNAPFERAFKQIEKAIDDKRKRRSAK
jgi:transcriptional regulator with XRE-family HTH domain